MKYKVQGYKFSPTYGYLAVNYNDVFEGKNKSEAIKKAKEVFTTCNKFIATKIEEENNDAISK